LRTSVPWEIPYTGDSGRYVTQLSQWIGNPVINLRTVDIHNNQAVEATNEECKLVFEIRHLTSYTRSMLKLQAIFLLFAASFIRFTSLWLSGQCLQVSEG
jgi:hypothetical protein